MAKGDAQVHAYAADLTKLREVKALAACVSKEHPTLAELIQNAGRHPWRASLHVCQWRANAVLQKNPAVRISMHT